MEASTKLAIAGALAAGSIMAFGYARQLYSSSALDEAVRLCQNENKAPRGASAPAWASGNLVCDAIDLAALPYETVTGVQKQIVDAAKDVESARAPPWIPALVILLIFSTPYAWYFLLRRLRELSDAVRRRP